MPESPSSAKPPVLFPANVVSRHAPTQPHPVLTELARRLLDRLADARREFTSILNLSRDGGATAQLLPVQHPAAHLTTLTAADVPTLPEKPQFDAAILNLTLATCPDPLALLNNVRTRLRPDGLLLASTLGLGSFAEYRHAWRSVAPASNPVSPLTDVQDAAALLQSAKFTLPVADRDVLTLTFPTFEKMHATARTCGSRNYHPHRNPGLTTPRQHHAVQRAYQQLYARPELRPDCRLPTTLEVIYLHGYTPAPSQPQPLRPGSGKIRLVKILGLNR